MLFNLLRLFPHNKKSFVSTMASSTFFKSQINAVVEIEDEKINHSSDRHKEKQEEGEVKTATNTENRINPFASFAYQKSENVTVQPKKSRFQKFPVSNTIKKNRSLKNSKQANNKDTFACGKMRDLPAEEQERITKKWHSLVDATATLEVRRFQTLLAARLHARCQEPCVRKAMALLIEAFDGDLSVDQVAKADPEDLVKYMTNLQYYNTKAKQIVKAAQEIKTRFGGIVPEDEESLLQITGIGKVFADLLAFVNKRSAHREDVDFKEV